MSNNTDRRASGLAKYARVPEPGTPEAQRFQNICGLLGMPPEAVAEVFAWAEATLGHESREEWAASLAGWHWIDAAKDLKWLWANAKKRKEREEREAKRKGSTRRRAPV